MDVYVLNDGRVINKKIFSFVMQQNGKFSSWLLEDFAALQQD